MVTETNIKLMVKCPLSKKYQNDGCLHYLPHEHTDNCQAEICPMVNDLVICKEDLSCKS